MLLETDSKFQKFIINECVDFKLACNAYGINLRASKSGVCFCPFHYNKNTPSAKLYSSGLYCFSENRSFYVSDLFEYDLVDDSIVNVFNNIWSLLDDSKKDAFILSFRKNEDSINLNSLQKNFIPLLDYRRNLISYSEYCVRLLEVLKKESGYSCVSELLESSV